MTIYALGHLVTILCVAGLASFVFLRNSQSRTNQTYALYCLSVIVWGIGDFLCYTVTDPKIAVFAGRITFSGGFFIALTGYHFSAVFVDSKIDRKIIPFFYVLNLLFVYICNYTDLYTTSVCKYFWGFYPEGNAWALITGIMYYVFSIRSIIILLQHMRNARREGARDEYNRSKYVLLAMIASTFAGLDYLAVFHIPFYPAAHLFALGMLLAIAYAILRHKLLDIEVVIKKTLIFGALFMGAYAIFASFAFLGQTFAERFIATNRWLAMIPSVIIITFMLRPLENFLVKMTDRYLFQKKYEYKDLLNAFAYDVLTELDMDRLLDAGTGKLAGIIKARSAAIIVLDRKGAVVRVRSVGGVKTEGCAAPATLVEAFVSGRGYVRRGEEGNSGSGGRVTPLPSLRGANRSLSGDEAIPQSDAIDRQNQKGRQSSFSQSNDADCEIASSDNGAQYPPRNDDHGSTAGSDTNDTDTFLRSMDAMLAIGLVRGAQVTGILTLGPKLSDREYNKDDLDILLPISHTLALAISNAELSSSLLRTQAESAEKEKLALIGTLAAGMAHEIRNPITTIRIFAEYLPERSRDTAFLERFYGLIPREIDRVDAIARSLLEFSGHETQEDEDVSIRAVFDIILPLIEPQCRFAETTVAVAAQAEVSVHANKRQIQDALFNVLKYIVSEAPNGSEVSISAAREGRWGVRIDIANDKLVVSDAVLKDVFEPEEARYNERRGFGLGLFIAKRLIEKNRGSFAIVNNPSPGLASRFVVTLGDA